MVFGLFASMIAMWFSRHREFRADAGGATLAGREKMIAALQRLAQTYGQSTLPKQVAAFGISGGGRRTACRRLLMSHPPLEERIAALRNAPLSRHAAVARLSASVVARRKSPPIGGLFHAAAARA